MIAALLALAAAVPADTARLAFLEGDLVTLERERALRSGAGEDVSVGELALLADLSRLVRCLPLGPVPLHESAELAAVRLLVRLERVRLESLMRDNIFTDTALSELLGEPPLYAARVVDRGRDEWVRWPIDGEVWPGEVIDPVPEAARCAARPGGMRESSGSQHAQRARVRARVLRELTAAALAEAPRLPDAAAARVALAYVGDAEGTALVVPSEWRVRLAEALRRGEPRVRAAGLLALARLAERSADADAARALYHELLHEDARTDDEDSRARARLAGLEEPRWEQVLEIVRAVRSARAADRPALDNAEARALYGLERWTELESFGRVWLRSEPGDDPFNTMTRDLLLRVGLQLEPPAAMAWALELGPGDPAARTARLDALGRLAAESGNLALATAVYDRLRLEASSSRARVGPGAAVDEARWIAERALIEFREEDAESFGGLVEDIVTLAKKEQDRPLARWAPHRELARLCQELMGRLTNEVARDPERRKFAAHLLEAAVELTPRSGRWQAVLEDLRPSLAALAGPYAVGRDRAALAAPEKRPKKTRRVRLLGEVVVPRLPPRLELPDEPTPLPSIDSFLVYPNASGAWVTGAPWDDAAEARARAKTP